MNDVSDSQITVIELSKFFAFVVGQIECWLRQIQDTLRVLLPTAEIRWQLIDNPELLVILHNVLHSLLYCLHRAAQLEQMPEPNQRRRQRLQLSTNNSRDQANLMMTTIEVVL